MTPLSLPVQVSRSENVNNVALPVALAMAAAPAAFAWVYWRAEHVFAQPLLLILLAAFIMAMWFYLCVADQPSRITITPSSLDIKPISVWGLTKAAPSRRSIAEFDHLAFIIRAVTRSGVTYRIAFRGKNGHADVLFDPPNRMIAKEYAAQLGETLNMKVKDEAGV